MSAEHRSKYAAPHRQWLPLDMSEKSSSGTKQTNKQTNNGSMYRMLVMQGYLVHYSFSNSAWHLMERAYKV